MIYRYECKECGELFSYSLPVDKRGKPNEEPCPFCQEEDCIIRVIHAPPVHLKGSGWSDDGFANLLGDDPKFKKGEFTNLDVKD